MAGMSEVDWEHHLLDQLAEFGWRWVQGVAVSPRVGERPGWDDLTLLPRLRTALHDINPALPTESVDDAVAHLRRRSSQDALLENFTFHRLLTQTGIRVGYTDAEGRERNPTVWAIDFDDPYANEFLAVNQVTISDGKRRRRLDVVCYVNGLPLAVIELKKAGAEDDSHTAFLQLQAYRRELGVLGFAMPIVAVVTDGITARIGTPFTPWEHMAPWNVDEDGRPTDIRAGNALEVLINGAFEPTRFLDLIANFVSYSADSGGAVDTVRLAKAHQVHAVNKAVDATVRAVSTNGKAGVVWHTQGSGKSKEMEFYVNKVARHPALANPTVLILTDRVDLDAQLYQTFSASELLPGIPAQANTRIELRDRLNTPGGGIIFSTLQKFTVSTEDKQAGLRHPMLSDRRNLIVVVDEAHRSHYDFRQGLARHLHDALPNATFIAFTGTPISKKDADTRAVFGPDIDVYDLTRAVDDGATVPVFYENRHIPVHLPTGVDIEELNQKAEEITADLDPDEMRARERDIAILRDVVGAPARLSELAKDIVEHWEVRREQLIKLTGVPGKAMIVGLTREICALLYAEIIDQRSTWAANGDDQGIIKVAYTGKPGEESAVVAEHVRTAARLKAIQRRLKDPEDELELVIVQSLWLTGFDAPPLHTLYLDRRMRGATLMQALARVNRRFGDKPSGLVVDYLGIADDLTRALVEYTVDDQERKPVGRKNTDETDTVRELHGILDGQLRGCDWRTIRASGSRTAHHDAAVAATAYLKRPEPDLPEGKPTAERRFVKATRDLLAAFALCPREPEIADLIDDIAFFETVRIYLAKWEAEERVERGETSRAEVEFLIRQLTAGAVAVDEVVDIYAAAGLEKPDLSHLDEAFVRKLRESRYPELALEALRRAIEKEIKAANPHNIVRQHTFTERLLATMRRYTNGALTSAEIINELVAMAREVSADRGRAKELGLTSDELAFYDAVAANESAVRQLGPNVLAEIARDLVTAVRKDRAVDWSVREQVQARLRSKIKRLLARHGYPPDAEARAVELVLQQAETFAEEDDAEVSSSRG